MNVGEIANHNEFSIKGIYLKNESGGLVNIRDYGAMRIMCLPSAEGKKIHLLYFNSNDKKTYGINDLVVDNEITITTNEQDTVFKKQDIYYLGIEKDDRNNRYCITLTLK